MMACWFDMLRWFSTFLSMAEFILFLPGHFSPPAHTTEAGPGKENRFDGNDLRLRVWKRAECIGPVAPLNHLRARARFLGQVIPLT